MHFLFNQCQRYTKNFPATPTQLNLPRSDFFFAFHLHSKYEAFAMMKNAVERYSFSIFLKKKIVVRNCLTFARNIILIHSHMLCQMQKRKRKCIKLLSPDKITHFLVQTDSFKIIVFFYLIALMKRINFFKKNYELQLIVIKMHEFVSADFSSQSLVKDKYFGARE